MKNRDKPSILFIIPDLRIGGAEIMLMTLLLGVKESVTVNIISFYGYRSAITKKIEESGIDIIFLNKENKNRIQFMFHLIKTINIIKPDIIHTHRYSISYVIPAIVFKKKIILVHTFHSLAQKETTTKLIFLNKFLFKIRRVIGVSLNASVHSSLMETYKMNSVIINNGININEILVKSSYAYDNPFKIIHVGRLSKPKNHKLIIDTVKKLVEKNYRVTVDFFGDGELRDSLSEYINESKLVDFILLKGNSDNINELLWKYDAFVLPSKYEGFPLSLIEAMASALPICVSDKGGIKDIIGCEECLFVDIDREDSLMESIIQLIESYNLRENLGKKAKQKSKMYNDIEMNRKYIELYNSLLV